MTDTQNLKTESIPFLRNSLDGIYVVFSDTSKLFHLKDLSFIDVTPSEDYEPGFVLKKNVDGTLENFEISDSVKDQLTEDEEIIERLNMLITDNCTGKTNYDVAWWAGSFNNFMQGFCYRHFEV